MLESRRQKRGDPRFELAQDAALISAVQDSQKVFWLRAESTRSRRNNAKEVGGKEKNCE